VAGSPRSLVVDEPLLRRIAANASWYTLTRPWAIVMWAVLAAALVVSIRNTVVAGADADVLTAWLPVAVAALGAYAVWLTTASTRRAVRAAMPAESTVWGELLDDRLRVGVGRRTSEIPFSTFRSVHARRDAVLLRLHGASAVTALPRALFTDEDIALLRSRIG
jgi:hypothetical protein